jgi:TPR repeat protein
MTGNTVEHNPPVAVSLFQESSNQGHVDATCKYAKCIMEGVGCDKNPVKAYQLFSQAEEQGSSEALFHLPPERNWDPEKRCTVPQTLRTGCKSGLSTRSCNSCPEL